MVSQEIDNANMIKNYLKSNLLNDNSDPNYYRGSLGHCMYNYISGLLLSKKLDFEFIHSDLTNASSRFNDLLNLKSEFKTIDQITFDKKIIIPSVQLNPNMNLLEWERLHNPDYDSVIRHIKNQTDMSSITLFELGTSEGNHFPGKLIDDSEWIVEKFQRAYWKRNSSLDTIYNPDNTNIAIHLRRGDVRILNHPDRWKDNIYYIDIINKLKRRIKNPKFFIFSEGDETDFLDFKYITDLNVNFYKFSLSPIEGNSSILKNIFSGDVNIISGGIDVEIFHHLVAADYLVTGQSTFSTLAAYFNRGLIIYTPCINFARFDKFNSMRFIHIKNI